MAGVPPRIEDTSVAAYASRETPLRRYRNYLLVVLLVVLAFNSADRLALGIALQNIKGDLHLSDSQLGFLTGLAFTAFYAIAGIPIARWADSGNRAHIVAVTTAVWGVMVALTGRAASFSQLLLIRIGVGVGDAGIAPTANSLIPDYFVRAERPRASAIYNLAVPLTMLLGYLVAGWLNEYLGWRAMFLFLGMPGLALAVVARYTLREPRIDAIRGLPSLGADATASSLHPALMDVLQTLRANGTYRHLLVCYSVMVFYGAGVQQWQPAFFIRSFGMHTGELGSWLALLTATGSLVCIYAGGEFASRYAADNERLQFRVIAAVCIGIGIDHVGLYLSPNRYVAFFFVGLGTMAWIINAPLVAALQTLIPSRMRATAMAVVWLFANLIGAGLGPMAAGALSDALRPTYGDQSLRFALLALSPLCVWGAWHMWLASRTVANDLGDEPPSGGSRESRTVEKRRRAQGWISP